MSDKPDKVYPLSVSNPQSANLVFNSLFDGKYLVEVVRVIEVPETLHDVVIDQEQLNVLLGYCGELFIFEKDEPHTLLHRQVVHLAYAAQFGPDMSDVSLWEDICSAFVDGTLDKFYINNPEMKDLTVETLIKGKADLLKWYKALQNDTAK